MQCYKIIQNQTIIGIGSMLVRWYDRTNRWGTSHLNDAMAIMDDISQQLYRATWMRAVPNGVISPSIAEVIGISEEEYHELYDELSGGEIIPEPIPEPEPEPTPEPEPAPIPTPDEETPMSIQEMREKIKQLTELVANETKPFTATKTYYTNDIIANGLKVYIANTVIIAGETVLPGVNCTETTIADVINTLQAEIEED